MDILLEVPMDKTRKASRHIIINEMDEEFRVRYFYTLKGEYLSHNVEKEYDKQSPVETVVLWYLVWYKWDELRNFMKCQGTRITRELDGMRVTLENAESDKYTKIMFNEITDMLIEFAQDYSYTEVPVRLRNAITFMVQSDPPDAVKNGDVVLVSNKYFGLVGHQDKLDDTRIVLIQRAEDLQIYKETVDVQSAHEELIEKLCIIETLKQKHQVQIVLQGSMNVSGTKRNVENCVAEYNCIVLGIKSEADDISESLVDLLKNEEVQDYILEELRRENIRCVWRVDEHECKVLVYSLDTMTSREACTIICESIGERTYPKEICTNHEIQGLLKRHESLLKISERDEALYIVGVGKIIENIDDAVKHQRRMQEIHKQVKSGNTSARGSSRVQNEAGKYKQDKTGKRDGRKHSLVQKTDVLGHKMAQCPYDLKDEWRHDMTQASCNDDDLRDSVIYDMAQTSCNDDDVTNKVRYNMAQAPCNNDDLTDKERQDFTQAPCNDDDLIDGVTHDNTEAPCNDDDVTDKVRYNMAQAPCNDDDQTDGVRHDFTQDPCNDDDLTDGVRHDFTQAPCNDDDLTDGVRHDFTQAPCNDDDLTDGVRHDITQAPCNDDVLTDEVRHDITQASCNNDDLTDEVRHDITQAPCNDDDRIAGVTHDNTEAPCNDNDVTDKVRYNMAQAPCDDDDQTDGVRHDFTQDPCNDDDLTDGVRHDFTQAPCNDEHLTDEVQYGMAQSPLIDDDIHIGLIDQLAALPIVRQQFPVEQPPPATSKDQSFRIERSTFYKLENPEMRAIVKSRLQEAQLQCQWQVQAKGYLYYLLIVSDKSVIIRDMILQTADQYKSKVSKPVREEAEVRLHIDNDRLIYIQEHQKETPNIISDRYGVTVNLEFNDEFVINGERENTYQAKSELMKLSREIQCCKAAVEADTDLGRPEITAKLRDLEMKERCVIEFPGVQLYGPRCLYSWVFSRMIVTITCGPVENSTADIIVLPVNAQGDVLGDSDFKQEYGYFDQCQAKSKFIKEKILCLPNSTTLDCLTIALAYIPEWTHEKQIDDGKLKKFDKLLKYAIDKGIRSVVIPVEITEGFPFSTFGYKLVLRFLSQQRYLDHRLEIFLCTRTVYNGYLLKSKLKHPLCNSDEVTEVLFDIERPLGINRGLCQEKALQIVVQSESMISMQSKVDVIVTFVGSNLDLSEGCVSRSLLNAGGRTVQKECSQNYPYGICYDDVAVTGPGTLQCKMLCHGAILGTWIPSGNFSLRILKSVLRKCLAETDKRQYKTIAIPAVGTGYPYHRVAEAMFDVVTEYQRDRQNTCITDVFFVIHQDDQKTLKAFEFQEKRNRKRTKQLHTAVKGDQPVEYIESFLPDPPLRFQIFQRKNAPLIIDKPETVVTFDYYRSTGPFVYKLNMDGNYLDITAHNDGTYETFKMVVKEILNMTEENQITSVAFHVDLNSFAIRSPIELAECVKDAVYLRTFPGQSLPRQTTKQVCHYIRQIQFVVYNKIDIRSYMPSKTKRHMKKLVTYPLVWHFVSYIIRGNNVYKVLAKDGATLKRVQDEVRRLVKKQVQKREPDHGDDMREDGLSVPLTEEDYNAFRFFAASKSWFNAVENCLRWKAGILCIKNLTDESKEEALQLLKEVKEMKKLDYPLTENDLDKASDLCSEMQKECQDVYISCKLKDRNITIKSSRYLSNQKVKCKLDLSFGRNKVP